jgi:hypothetical protein
VTFPDSEIGVLPAQIRKYAGRPVLTEHLARASAAIKDSIAGEAPPELLDLPDSRERARALITDEDIKAAWNKGPSYECG